MKRILALILAALFVLSFAACGADGNGDNLFGGTENTNTPGTESSPAGDDALFEKTVGSRTVKFYGAPGHVTSIVCGDDRLDVDASSADASFGFITKDMNFDGEPDFAIEKSSANGVVTYACFFYGKTEGKFVPGGEFGDPIFDAERSKIYSTSPDGTFKMYTVKDGRAEASGEGVNLNAAPDFKTDLSAYEQYMAPADRDGYLLLVNHDHPIGEDFVPENLTDLVDTRNDRAAQQMTLVAAKALEALYIELRAAGYSDVSVTSAYRSYARQKEIFDMYLNMNLSNGYDYDTAYAMVASDTALPGESEHQSGLCCDMHNLGSASQAFANQPAYKWLVENCWKFGFILRYPADKEASTKITYEPWHYRFVGRYHAARIHETGLSFEEYISLIG